MLKDLIRQNRSYRRFYQDVAIDTGTLRAWVDLARLSPSAMNLQPLRFILSNTPEKNAVIFDHLAWARYISDWPGPAEGERPAAYIIILGDNRIKESIDCDHGIAAQSMLLGAVEQGFGGCIIASIQREKLRAALDIPDYYAIRLALALGKPKESVMIDPLGADGDIKYWRDDNAVHHVPKRALDDLIIG
ncbi:MAG: nitroreductase family protein [Anaerolineae bacterium]|nr:nitroreductase family protein [Anaerolineae bacterium]